MLQIFAAHIFQIKLKFFTRYIIIILPVDKYFVKLFERGMTRIKKKSKLIIVFVQFRQRIEADIMHIENVLPSIVSWWCKKKKASYYICQKCIDAYTHRICIWVPVDKKNIRKKRQMFDKHRHIKATSIVYVEGFSYLIASVHFIFKINDLKIYLLLIEML